MFDKIKGKLEDIKHGELVTGEWVHHSVNSDIIA